MKTIRFFIFKVKIKYTRFIIIISKMVLLTTRNVKQVTQLRQILFAWFFIIFFLSYHQFSNMLLDEGTQIILTLLLYMFNKLKVDNFIIFWSNHTLIN